MAANWCAIKRTLQPESRFSATTSRMYFLPGDDTARSETGLVQQTVQIVASHDLTLVVSPYIQTANVGSRRARVSRHDVLGLHLQITYFLPTADGTSSSPNALAIAVIARHPVQWPAAMSLRLKAFRSEIVSGMIFSVTPER